MKLGLSSLDLPLDKVYRNIFVPPSPPAIKGRHGPCDAAQLARELTIVVTVKDACSQAPGFIKALEAIVPPAVHLIYTYPNFTSCASIDMSKQLERWDKVTLIPLPLRVSPMQGWLDAIPKTDTPYSLLLHNDGYALDEFFACELLEGLKARKREDPQYVVAAPMLYESKSDGSLAAHATQSNLRLVPNNGMRGAGGVGGTGGMGSMDGVGGAGRDNDGGGEGEGKGEGEGEGGEQNTQWATVRHDHSPARALNRGEDYPEGPQMDFLEDHGFLIETDKIAAVIDPHGSYTLEYLDMIMSIRSNNWKVRVYTPQAALPCVVCRVCECMSSM